MIEYSKVRKKFGWNDILPYIEISKPKLRNNLNQLFAMKNNSIFLPATLVAIFFAVSATCILDPAPSANIKSPARIIENHIVEKMLAHQQAKLAEVQAAIDNAK